MIKAIIIDDEPHCINRLRTLIGDYCINDVAVIGWCSDIDSAYEHILLLKPDCIFLDIQIHDRTGFDLLRRFDVIDFAVVFATAYEQYAVQAFKFSAVDYLLKPVDPDDLTETVQRIKQKLSDHQVRKNLEIAADNYQNLKNGKLTIPTLDGKEIFDIPDITHCEASGNYTIFNFNNRKPLKDSRTLKRYDEILIKHGFYRIHSSHLINLSYIKRVENGRNSFVVMQDNHKIPISTRKKEDFMKRLGEL